MNNYRIYVEKYPEFQVEARSLLHELNENLQLELASLRYLNVYDLFGFSEELLQKTLWNHYDGYSLALVYCNVAGRTWNTEARTAKYGSYSAFKTHLREICWDMKLKNYREFGINHYQVPYDNMPNPLL